MLNGIDISSNNEGITPSLMPIDFCIIKATEGLGYVDPPCDRCVSDCIDHNILWGFYHFARDNDPVVECQFFIDQCRGYLGRGIPCLDWECGQSVYWVNTFVRYYHEKTGVWPWIYSNPRFFNQGGVEPNCARWVAAYPSVTSPTFEQAKTWEVPQTDGLVAAWQFCSDGRIPGYGGNLDCNLFYGNADAWRKYAGISTNGGENVEKPSESVLENGRFKVVITEK